MNEEWNLKDRLSKYNPNHTSGEPSVYYEKDVETLRQKLVEDIKKYFDNWGSRYYTTLGYAVEEIINKRFR